MEIEKQCKEKSINYLSYYHEDYPRRFKEFVQKGINDFPIILFYIGDIHLMNEKKICSVIGTRNPSNQAICYEKKIVKSMVNNGYIILSGLAEGCDSIAHQTCLECKQKTIAIVGTGVDIVFPKKNTQLYEQIIRDKGLILSEYNPGFKGASFAFIQRDRLQAEGSDVIITIQSSIDGGTMHASKSCSKKYGRKLIVLSPNEVADGDMAGNAELIKNFDGIEVTLSSLNSTLN